MFGSSVNTNSRSSKQVEAMMNDVAVLTFERNVVDAFGDFRGMARRLVTFGFPRL